MLDNYIIRRMIEPGGERRPKFPPLIKDDPNKLRYREGQNCKGCGKPVGYKLICGHESLDGWKAATNFWHNPCWNTFTAVPNVPSNTVYTGNLDNAEYRFWIGLRPPLSTRATCRVCKKEFYTADERSKHLKDPSMAVGGLRCAERMTDALKHLIASYKSCLVCKTDRYHQTKWGVPLCGQAFCENSWRFDTNRYIPLEVQFERQKREADRADQTKAQKANKGNWCDTCAMFDGEFGKDGRCHAVIHADWINEAKKWRGEAL